MTLLRNAKEYAWGEWYLGIMRSFISGGSSSMVAAMAGMGIAPDKFNLQTGNGGGIWHTAELMLVMFVFQGLYRMFEFLTLHSAPDKVVTEEKTTNIQPQGDGIKATTVIKTTTTTDPPKGTE
jgi:hypothetical protein